MAEELHFQAAEVKKRHPWGVWGLSIVTIGVYGLVWWYKINRELRDYSAAAGAPLDNNPTRSVLAFLPGAFIIVPPFVSIWRTCERIEGVRATVEGRSPQSIASTGLLAILLYIVAALHPVLLGYAMNDLWDAARQKAGEGTLPRLSTGPAA